jgi:hypothetical protein
MLMEVYHFFCENVKSKFLLLFVKIFAEIFVIVFVISHYLACKNFPENEYFRFSPFLQYTCFHLIDTVISFDHGDIKGKTVAKRIFYDCQ